MRRSRGEARLRSQAGSRSYSNVEVSQNRSRRSREVQSENELTDDSGSQRSDPETHSEGESRSPSPKRIRGGGVKKSQNYGSHRKTVYKKKIYKTASSNRQVMKTVSLAKKEPSYPYSTEELEVLCSKYQKHFQTLVGTQKNFDNILVRSTVWDDISKAVSKVGNRRRNAKSCQEKISKLKTLLKKEETFRRQLLKETGGGSQEETEYKLTKKLERAPLPEFIRDLLLPTLAKVYYDGVPGGIDSSKSYIKMDIKKEPAEKKVKNKPPELVILDTSDEESAGEGGSLFKRLQITPPPGGSFSPHPWSHSPYPVTPTRPTLSTPRRPLISPAVLRLEASPAAAAQVCQSPVINPNKDGTVSRMMSHQSILKSPDIAFCNKLLKSNYCISLMPGDSCVLLKARR